MWLTFLTLSVLCLVMTTVSALIIKCGRTEKSKTINCFNLLLVGIFLSSFFMFIPIHVVTEELSFAGGVRAVLLSLFNSMQVFAFGCEFDNLVGSIAYCPAELSITYQIWVSLIFLVAPVFTFSFVLSLFKNVSADLKYWCSYFKDVYVFSELNEKSIALANDIRKKGKNVLIVFTDVFEGNEEKTYEMVVQAKKMGALCFKKDVLAVNFKRHAVGRKIVFFTIGGNESENLNQSLNLIENYRNRENTHLYIFSTRIESELLLTAVDKGKIRVRRVNEVQSLINRILYEQGKTLFESAREDENGERRISAVVIGMGNHGTERVKALSWYGQMDGYRLEIHAFDKDPLAEERFTALAPELMSPDYNGVYVEGEAQYSIAVHSNTDVQTGAFADAISRITNATYVFVALGNDELNINTAVNLRMYFERMKIRPVIQAVVYSSQQKRALEGITNYRGQAYGIEFVGDVESSYTEKVVIDSELESAALKRHLKWGKEEEFWTYEYNYRSSTASAIHMKARVECGIPGADKAEDDLTVEERDVIEKLEHRRWNAYMRLLA